MPVDPASMFCCVSSYPTKTTKILHFIMQTNAAKLIIAIVFRQNNDFTKTQRKLHVFCFDSLAIVYFFTYIALLIVYVLAHFNVTVQSKFWSNVKILAPMYRIQKMLHERYKDI